MPYPRQMAVPLGSGFRGFDTVVFANIQSTNDAGLPFAYTVPAGTDVVLIGTSASRLPASITVDGNPATKVADIGHGINTSLYRFPNPPVGSVSINVTWPVGPAGVGAIGVLSVSGVFPNPVRAVVTAAVDGTSLAAAVSSAPGDEVLGVHSAGGNQVPTVQGTEIWSNGRLGQNGKGAQKAGAAPTVTMGHTVPLLTALSLVAASIQPKPL